MTVLFSMVDLVGPIHPFVNDEIAGIGLRVAGKGVVSSAMVGMFFPYRHVGII